VFAKNTSSPEAVQPDRQPFHDIYDLFIWGLHYYNKNNIDDQLITHDLSYHVMNLSYNNFISNFQIKHPNSKERIYWYIAQTKNHQ